MGGGDQRGGATFAFIFFHSNKVNLLLGRGWMLIVAIILLEGWGGNGSD